MDHVRSLPVPRRTVASVFPASRGLEFELKAFAFTLLFYVLYAAMLAGVAPGWAFLAAGPLIMVRSFNALHETFHVGNARLSGLRWVAIVVGPIQLGYDQFRACHHSHHSHQGGPDDMEAYLVRGSLPVALLHAFTQPEQALFRYLQRRRLDAKLLAMLLLNAALFCAMMAIGWGWAAVMYNVVVRVGNTFTWLTFHWILHHPRCTDGLAPLPLPKPLAAAWWLALGPDNLAGSMHHELHHAYPSVPDSKLRELSTWLDGARRSGA